MCISYGRRRNGTSRHHLVVPTTVSSMRMVKACSSVSHPTSPNDGHALLVVKSSPARNVIELKRDVHGNAHTSEEKVVEEMESCAGSSIKRVRFDLKSTKIITFCRHEEDNVRDGISGTNNRYIVKNSIVKSAVLGQRDDDYEKETETSLVRLTVYHHSQSRWGESGAVHCDIMRTLHCHNDLKPPTTKSCGAQALQTPRFPVRRRSFENIVDALRCPH